jgi:hypothetical protein
MKTSDKHSPLFSLLDKTLNALGSDNAPLRMLLCIVLLFMLALLVSYGIFRLYFILPLPQEPLAAVFIEKMVIWTMGICFVWGMGGVFFRTHSGVVLDPLLPEDSQQYVFVIEILTYQTLLFNCGFCLVCLCKIFADDLVGMGEQVMLLVSIPALCAIAISRYLWRRYYAGIRFVALAPLRRSNSINQYENDVQMRAFAAHEAGYMLMFAALQPIPKDIILHLDKQAGTAIHSSSDVNPDFDTQRLCDNRTYMDWQMLLWQAGTVAEQYLIGREVLDAADDYLRWLHCASTYMVKLFWDDLKIIKQQQNLQIRFFLRGDPALRELSVLKLKQCALLQTFFRLNNGVLRDLSAAAQEKRTLRRDDLLPFFARVRFPEGFPRPDLTVLTED